MTEGLDTRNLDKLAKLLKESMGKVRVGILGGSARSGGGPTNAEVGSFHEFGTSKLPVRSFLRMPLTEELPKAIEKSGLFDKDSLKEVMAEGSTVPWLKRLGIVAEGVVADAFDSKGFGRWQPSDMRNKRNQQTLVETQQLRNSITSQVKA